MKTITSLRTNAITGLFNLIASGVVTCVFCIMPSLAQEDKKNYAKGLRDDQAFLMDTKIVEIDSILNVGKEAVPFDKPVALKIKRINKGEQKRVSKNIVTVETISEEKDDQGNLVRKTVRKEEYDESPEKAYKVEPAQILDLRLDTDEAQMNLPVSNIVKQSAENSDFVFVSLKKLRPDKIYHLKVTWGNDAQGNRSAKDTTVIYTFTTVSPTLDKRVKERLVSQLGLAPIFFRSGSSIYDFQPAFLLGVHYHLRAVDPDIPTKYYKAYGLQRFSIFGAVTVNSIARDGVRDDLFGKNNLLFGVGYQLADAVRLSYGAVLFREVTPNALAYQSRSVAANSYVAITLDIKLKDILAGILTTFGFK